jgi:hypothetical protein
VTVEEIVRGKIVADEVLTNTLEERVSPVHIPDHEYPLPWLMYRVESSEPTIDLEGNVIHVLHTVRMDVLAASYAEAVSIEKRLNHVLHSRPGKDRPAENVEAIFFAGSAKSPRDEGFQVEMTYHVHADGSTVFPAA